MDGMEVTIGRHLVYSCHAIRNHVHPICSPVFMEMLQHRHFMTIISAVLVISFDTLFSASVHQVRHGAVYFCVMAAAKQKALEDFVEP